MRQPPGNSVFYRFADGIPAHVKRDRDILPAHPLGPACQKPLVTGRQPAFPLRPRHSFYLHSARGTLHTPHGVDEVDSNAPQRNKLEASFRQPVVTRSHLVATRADRPPVLAGMDRYFDRRPGGVYPLNFSVDKRLEMFDAIENSVQLHPGLALEGRSVVTPSLPRTARDASLATPPHPTHSGGQTGWVRPEPERDHGGATYWSRSDTSSSVLPCTRWVGQRRREPGPRRIARSGPPTTGFLRNVVLKPTCFIYPRIRLKNRTF